MNELSTHRQDQQMLEDPDFDLSTRLDGYSYTIVSHSNPFPDFDENYDPWKEIYGHTTRDFEASRPFTGRSKETPQRMNLLYVSPSQL